MEKRMKEENQEINETAAVEADLDERAPSADEQLEAELDAPVTEENVADQQPRDEDAEASDESADEFSDDDEIEQLVEADDDSVDFDSEQDTEAVEEELVDEEQADQELDDEEQVGEDEDDEEQDSVEEVNESEEQDSEQDLETDSDEVESADVEDSDDEEPVEEPPQEEDIETTVESVIEAVLFASDEALTPARLAAIVEVDTKQVREHIENLNARYKTINSAFRIERIAGGYQMLTLSPYNHWLRKLLRVRSDSKLSPAALETLAIVAYKQPVIRADIEAIRGVAAGEVLRSLMYKGLVKIVGRAEILGRPMLYGTTKKFLEVFGLNSIKDLPKVEELKKPSQ